MHSPCSPLASANDDEPAMIVPSHGAMADANMIAYQRGFFQGVQAACASSRSRDAEPQILASATDE